MIEVQQLEQRQQPAIVAAVVVDVAAVAESFVASLLMTMRADVVVEDPVVVAVAAAVAIVAVEWRLAHPVVTASLACPREYSNHHFDFLTSLVKYAVVPSGGT